MNYNKKNYLLVILFYFFVIENSYADKPYFDLSDEMIKIETTFKGKEIIVFGLADPNFDTILIIKGPNKDAKLSIKERLFGIWIETKSFSYKQIPSIFFIAASAPIHQILDENIIRQKGIDFKHFDYKGLKENNITKIYEDSLYNWDINLIRKQKINNLYKIHHLKIVNEKLFQTRIFFPENTIPGEYYVHIYQVKDKKIINEDKKRIIIKKTGFGSNIYNFAHGHPFFYGIVCIIFAVVSGIIAATAFRRL